MKELKEVVDKLKELNAKRVFIQYPEGLSGKILDIAKEIEKSGIETVLCLQATYGACDVRDVEAKRLGCDAILHIAHTDYGVKSELPVIYWEYFLDGDAVEIFEGNFERIRNFKRIGLLCSLQYCKLLPEVKAYLESKGFEVFVVKGEKYEGQVLGCRHFAATAIEKKVDAFLILSAGKFHGLGVALKVSKPVFVVDLEAKRLFEIKEEKERVERIVAWNREVFREAKKVGILVSWKKGQILLPYQLKKRIEAMGKEAYILAFDELNESSLEGLNVDVLVNTACPRLGIDDLERFKVPVINLEDLKL